MMLSQDDISFFQDPESWRYGPTYDLVLEFSEEVGQEEVLKFFLEQHGFKK